MEISEQEWWNNNIYIVLRILKCYLTQNHEQNSFHFIIITTQAIYLTGSCLCDILTSQSQNNDNGRYKIDVIWDQEESGREEKRGIRSELKVKFL